MRVPKRKGEHAVEPRQRPLPPLRQGIEHNFGVSPRTEAVPSRLQLESELAKVVDLAVVAQDISAIGRRHRLMPCVRQVNDCEPTMPESEPLSDERPLPRRAPGG